MPIFQVTPLQPPAPSYGGHGGLDAGFVWQQLSEIQKTLGAIDAKLDQHKDAMAKQESDIGKIKADVAEFKQIRNTAKVLGWVGGVVLAGMLAVTGFVVKEVWTVLKPLAVQQIQAPGATQSK
jgi:hypothetical protein